MELEPEAPNLLLSALCVGHISSAPRSSYCESWKGKRYERGWDFINVCSLKMNTPSFCEHFPIVGEIEK